jgi:GxxExxY protein
VDEFAERGIFVTRLEERREPQITQIKRDARSYVFIGAATDVHRQLGPGYPESIYRQALAVALGFNGVVFPTRVSVARCLQGHSLSVFRADFLCVGKIIVEIKAGAGLTGADHAQLIHYLTASANIVGLLINFGSASLEYRRVISSLHSDAKSRNLRNLRNLRPLVFAPHDRSVLLI